MCKEMSDASRDPFQPPSLPLRTESTPGVIESAGDLPLSAAETQSKPPQAVFPPWSGWDVAAVLGFTLAAVFVLSSAALGIAHLLTSKQHVSWSDLASNSSVLIGSQIAAYPAVILFMILIVRSKSRESFAKAIRWNWPGNAVVGFFVSGAIFAVAVEFASRWLPIPKSLPVDKYFSDVAGAYLLAAFGVTLAPLLEELFFRGMLYPLLRKVWGVKAAVLVTAAAFASIHGAQLGYAWAPLLSIFAVGLVFTLVRERTGSVAASFLMHCGYNFMLFAMLWMGSDHFRHLEKVMS